jgi:hypothetical protein
MADADPESDASEREPKLRHEFVGMMFAVAIGEVGMQTAELVHNGSWIHYLPEYSHLILCTVLIASSWVGWTLSVAPGARRDVERIFQWEFLVLLLDVALVIIYFIVVRLVEKPPSLVASWIVGIFVLYFVWDIVTKVIIYFGETVKAAKKTAKEGKEDRFVWTIADWVVPISVTLALGREAKSGEHPPVSWGKNYGSRMIPTLVCIGLALQTKYLITTTNRARFLAADIALIALVLLFRALKELVSALLPTKPVPDLRKKRVLAILSTSICTFFLVLGVAYTYDSLPLPLSPSIVRQIGASAVQDAKP